MNNQLFLFLVGLFLCIELSLTKNSPPKVQIYSRGPGHYGKENILICHVSSFYPPELTVELRIDGEPIAKANQTDLAFEEDWHYHLTKHAIFFPEKNRKYTCTVTHLDDTKTYSWEPDM